MATPGVEYRRLELPSPPTEAILEGLAADGWRLVSVVAHAGRYVAFFERLALDPAVPGVDHSGAQAYRSFHERMAGVLRSQHRNPELQRLADGITRLNDVFVQMLREQIGEPELRRLAALDPTLAEALGDAPLEE